MKPPSIFTKLFNRNLRGDPAQQTGNNKRGTAQKVNVNPGGNVRKPAASTHQATTVFVEANRRILESAFKGSEVDKKIALAHELSTLREEYKKAEKLSDNLKALILTEESKELPDISRLLRLKEKEADANFKKITLRSKLAKLLATVQNSPDSNRAPTLSARKESDLKRATDELKNLYRMP